MGILYETNKELDKLCTMLEFECDPETGEIVDLDTVRAQLMSMSALREDILQGLAKTALNARAEAAAIKDEENRLKLRRQALERKDARLVTILDRESGGENANFGVADLKHRKTSSVVIENEDWLAMWLEEGGYVEAYSWHPTISKTEVKKIINRGNEVPFCRIEEAVSATLR